MSVVQWKQTYCGDHGTKAKCDREVWYKGESVKLISDKLGDATTVKDR